MKDQNIKKMYKECSSILTEKTKEIHHLVLGTGNTDASIMVIGDLPTEMEEEVGIVYLGEAKERLNKILENFGQSLSDVYLTHIVKYRPYRINERSGRMTHRAPNKEDIQFFMSYLEREIEIVQPKILLMLGEEPLKMFFKTLPKQEDLEEPRVFIQTIAGKNYWIATIPKMDSKEFNRLSETFEVRDLPALLKASRLDKNDRSALEERTHQEADSKVVGHSEEMTERELPNVSTQQDHQESDKPTRGSKAAENRPFIKTSIVRKSKPAGSKTKVVIVYGGDGYANDPTLVAVERIAYVLTELQVVIKRLDLYKNPLPMTEFFEEMSSADGVVLATTVEWYGIGGWLQSFLDVCFTKGRSELFEGIPLFGVVMARQAFEREGYNHLLKSWELLGGTEGGQLCGVLQNSVMLETNKTLIRVVDKKTEDYYRVLSQKREAFPTSTKTYELKIQIQDAQLSTENKTLDGTTNPLPTQRDRHPEKTPVITNYDEFVEKQQKDIDDLSKMFKSKLSAKTDIMAKSVPDFFKSQYVGAEDLRCKLFWQVTDAKNENTVVDLNGKKIQAHYGQASDADVNIFLSKDVLHKILNGKMSIQRAFMTGDVKAKGDFTILYKIDQIFNFTS